MSERSPYGRPLFEYGGYTVHLIEEPFETDGELQNYGVFRVDITEPPVCESTTSSYPQAISIAMALNRASDELLSELDKESKKEESAMPKKATLQ